MLGNQREDLAFPVGQLRKSIGRRWPHSAEVVGDAPGDGGPTVRRECLDRMLVRGERNLLATLNEYVTHHNEHRPRQGRDRPPPNTDHAPSARLDVASSRVKRGTILGGLISEYSQAA